MKTSSSRASKQALTWHSCMTTSKSLSGQPNPDLIQRLAIKGFRDSHTDISSGGSFWSSWWARFHGTLRFALHFFYHQTLSVWVMCLVAKNYSPSENTNKLKRLFCILSKKVILGLWRSENGERKDFWVPRIMFFVFSGLQKAENNLLALSTKKCFQNQVFVCSAGGGEGVNFGLWRPENAKKNYFGTQKIFLLPFSGLQRPKMTSWHEIYSCCSNLAFNSWWGDCLFYLI